MTNLPAKPTDKTSKSEKALRITRKVRDAIALMVWQGLNRAEAAEKAGLKDNSLYIALRKPDVKAHYLAECEVLRVSGKARRIHRLAELAEQNTNMNAAVNAIRTADAVEDGAHMLGSGMNRAPGLTVVVVDASGNMRPAPPLHVVDVTPQPLEEFDAQTPRQAIDNPGIDDHRAYVPPASLASAPPWPPAPPPVRIRGPRRRS